MDNNSLKKYNYFFKLTLSWVLVPWSGYRRRKRKRRRWRRRGRGRGKDEGGVVERMRGVGE